MCIHHDYTGIGVIQLYRVYAVSEFGLSDFTASNLFFFDALMTCPSFSLLSFVLDADFEAGDPTPVDPADPADPTDPVSGAFSCASGTFPRRATSLSTEGDRSI